ncbi:MAG: hypothetical protein ACP5JS_05975 [Fervidobacterium sp.]
MIEIKPFLFILFMAPMVILFNTTIFPAQYIYIDWFYDESLPIVISQTTTSVRIGYIEIYSEAKFKMYVNPSVYVGDSLNSDIKVNYIYIGKRSISMNPYKPTQIKNSYISGYLDLYFSFPPLLDDFKLVLTFVFLPF